MLNTFNTIFKESKRLAEDVYLFRFKLTEPKKLSFSAGQYMIIEIPQPDKTVKKRFISIASPQQNGLEFEGVMKIIPGGVASTFLLGLKEGDHVNFQGPAGMFTFQNNNRQNIFIATGTGIGPIRSILKTEIKKLRNLDINYLLDPLLSLRGEEKGRLISQFPSFYLYWGLRTLNDVYFFDELKQLTISNKQFSFKVCLSQEKTLEKIKEEDKNNFFLGRVTKELEDQIANHQLQITAFDFYLCGAKEVVDSLRQYLLTKGALPDQVHSERFS